ncbi:MAG: hypothetical protein U0360_07730 [Dehalococcoidia bacterium]
MVPRLERPGESPRYLLLRWRDWPPPALLSLTPPRDAAALQAAIVDAVELRLGVHASGPAILAGERRPARMGRGSRGGDGLGWLRVAAVRAEGVPEPDPLLEAVLELTLDEAMAALTSDVERAAFTDAARLFGDTPGA